MPNITFQLVQKPIEQRLIDAACIYWNVERDYFLKLGGKDESTVFYRKSIVYYLIKQNTQYSFREIAQLLGFNSHSPVIKSVENIEVQKVLKQTRNDLSNITEIADKLRAEFLTTSIQLQYKNPLE